MRPRLTFDPNPKELAHRDSGPAHVSLLWSRRTHRAAVVLYDDETGRSVELEVSQRRQPARPLRARVRVRRDARPPRLDPLAAAA